MSISLGRRPFRVTYVTASLLPSSCRSAEPRGAPWHPASGPVRRQLHQLHQRRRRRIPFCRVPCLRRGRPPLLASPLLSSPPPEPKSLLVMPPTHTNSSSSRSDCPPSWRPAFETETPAPWTLTLLPSIGGPSPGTSLLLSFQRRACGLGAGEPRLQGPGPNGPRTRSSLGALGADGRRPWLPTTPTSKTSRRTLATAPALKATMRAGFGRSRSSTVCRRGSDLESTRCPRLARQGKRRDATAQRRHAVDVSGSSSIFVTVSISYLRALPHPLIGRHVS